MTYWIIDGDSHKSTAIIERGVTENIAYDAANSLWTSVVTVTCSNQNNNTQLTCVAVLDDVPYISNTSLLLIQGKLFFSP